MENINNIITNIFRDSNNRAFRSASYVNSLQEVANRLEEFRDIFVEDATMFRHITEVCDLIQKLNEASESGVFETLQDEYIARLEAEDEEE